MYIGVEHHVQSADLMDEAEEIFQIYVLQVHRDRLSRVLGTAARRRLRHLCFLLRRHIHRRLNRRRRGRGRLCCLRLHRGIGLSGQELRSWFISESRRCFNRPGCGLNYDRLLLFGFALGFERRFDKYKIVSRRALHRFLFGSCYRTRYHRRLIRRLASRHHGHAGRTLTLADRGL